MPTRSTIQNQDYNVFCNTDEIAVIIPCYNEEKSIIAVIDEIMAALPCAQIYVFDNNSTDKSADLVKAKIAQIAQTQMGGGGIAHFVIARRTSIASATKQSIKTKWIATNLQLLTKSQILAMTAMQALAMAKTIPSLRASKASVAIHQKIKS